MPDTKWTIADFPSDDAALKIVAAFIAVACNADSKLKPRLKFFLSNQTASEPKAKEALNAAIDWLEHLKTGGTL
jgi:hypothetical protein